MIMKQAHRISCNMVDIFNKKSVPWDRPSQWLKSKGKRSSGKRVALSGIFPMATTCGVDLITSGWNLHYHGTDLIISVSTWHRDRIPSPRIHLPSTLMGEIPTFDKAGDPTATEA